MSGGIDFRRCFVEKTQWNRELQYVCDMMKVNSNAVLCRFRSSLRDEGLIVRGSQGFAALHPGLVSVLPPGAVTMAE